MQLGTDHRKLQRILQQPEKKVDDFGFWITSEKEVLQGWEKRTGGNASTGSSGKEEVRQAADLGEQRLRRGGETHLFELTDEEFIGRVKVAVDSAPHSMNQSQNFLTGMTKTFPALSKLNDEHFLVNFCTAGWFAKFLPSQFGIYLRFLDQPESSLLLIFRKGKLEGYQTPDLTGLQKERKKESGEVGRFLKARYAVPVQCVDSTIADWTAVCNSDHPWRVFMQGVRTKTFTLSPFRWGLVFGLSFKGFFGA